MEFSIRPVKPNDIDQVFNLLVNLSVYEGTSDMFILTKERLEKDLFGPYADWNCLLAADAQGKIIGICTYTIINIHRACHANPRLHIDDLYVVPEYRKMKAAYHLFQQLAFIAQSKNISLLSVWCFKNNELGQGFYQSLNFQKLKTVDYFMQPVTQFLELQTSL